MSSLKFTCISGASLESIDACLAGGTTVDSSLSGPGNPTGGIPGGYNKLSMLSWKDNGGSIGGNDSILVKSDRTTSYRHDWENSLWHYWVSYMLRFDACVLERYLPKMPMNSQKMEKYCLKTSSAGKSQESKSEDIQVNCGLLFPEFSTFTP